MTEIAMHLKNILDATRHPTALPPGASPQMPALGGDPQEIDTCARELAFVAHLCSPDQLRSRSYDRLSPLMARYALADEELVAHPWSGDPTHVATDAQLAVFKHLMEALTRQTEPAAFRNCALGAAQHLRGRVITPEQSETLRDWVHEWRGTQPETHLPILEQLVTWVLQGAQSHDMGAQAAGASSPESPQRTPATDTPTPIRRVRSSWA